MDKEKIKQQRVKLKESALKVLHVICYILSGLFLLTLLISGLQSCGGKTATGTSAEAPSGITNLTLTTWTISDSPNIDSYYEFPVGFRLQSGTGYDRLIIDNINRNIRYDYGADSTIVYSDFGWEDSNYQTLIFYGAFDDQNYDNEQLIEWLSQNATLDTKVDNFVFNKVFNYNAPMGQTLDSAYGMGANWTTQYDDSAVIDYDVGPFYSNGQLFALIRYRCFKGDSMDFRISTQNGTTSIKRGTSGCWSFMFLEYVDYNGVSTIACMRDSSPYVTNDGGYSFVQENSATWRVDAYRYLIFVGGLSTQDRTLIDMFNNNNQNAYNGSQVGGDINNVFTLVASAFTGLMPILGIYILPSVTLGTLLFIPLVATLVFVIIKVIKK